MSICPDCGKPDAVNYGDRGCLARCKDRIFRTSEMCRTDTIAKLRSDLASAKSAKPGGSLPSDAFLALDILGSELRDHHPDHNAQRALETIREALQWAEGQPAWYEECCKAKQDLASARAQVELTEAEREALEATAEWRAYDRSRPPKDPGFSTAPFCKWDNAMIRLAALRAGEKAG